jgi:hypothetical protein
MIDGNVTWLLAFDQLVIPVASCSNKAGLRHHDAAELSCCWLRLCHCRCVNFSFCCCYCCMQVQSYHISTMTVSERNALTRGWLGGEPGGSPAARQSPKPSSSAQQGAEDDDADNSGSNHSSDNEQRDVLETVSCLLACLMLQPRQKACQVAPQCCVRLAPLHVACVLLQLLACLCAFYLHTIMLLAIAAHDAVCAVAVAAAVFSG